MMLHTLRACKFAPKGVSKSCHLQLRPRTHLAAGCGVAATRLRPLSHAGADCSSGGSSGSRSAPPGRGLPRRKPWTSDAAGAGAGLPLAAGAAAAGLLLLVQSTGQRQECTSCDEKAGGTNPWQDKNVDNKYAEVLRRIRVDDAVNTAKLVMDKKLMKTVDTVLNKTGETPLAAACVAGAADVVEALLECGADPSVLDARGCSCVAKACEHGHLPIVKKLAKERRVDLSKRDFYGDAPIHLALAGRHLDISKFLLDMSVDPNLPTAGLMPAGDKPVPPPSFVNRRRGPPGEAPLHQVLRQMSFLENSPKKLTRYWALELLLAYGADITAKDDNGDSPLHLCARQGDLTGLWLLLSAERDAAAALRVTNEQGITALQEADNWGLDGSIVARLAGFLSYGVRKSFLDIRFADTTLIIMSMF
eukprot:TRINITY_DN29489_c0_g1_i1.p1 TRINITY_DN29489_c0_g1~~TRINITY_DN29489_c0_g1_i1.p1  ORF type:complete len:419 (+),score=112.93 TRINITY_DN29489_c0_g1_i1:67-1323(+)